MKKVDRTPKLSIGNKVKDPNRGLGVVRQVDKSNLDFFYFVDFTAFDKRGGKAWLSKKYTEGLKQAS